jgi:hypothetical protein
VTPASAADEAGGHFVVGDHCHVAEAEVEAGCSTSNSENGYVICLANKPPWATVTMEHTTRSTAPSSSSCSLQLDSSLHDASPVSPLYPGSQIGDRHHSKLPLLMTKHGSRDPVTICRTSLLQVFVRSNGSSGTTPARTDSKPNRVADSSPMALHNHGVGLPDNSSTSDELLASIQDADRWPWSGSRNRVPR